MFERYWIFVKGSFHKIIAKTLKNRKVDEGREDVPFLAAKKKLVFTIFLRI